jgi:uncharacterized protein YbjT (DUF2867 family)
LEVPVIVITTPTGQIGRQVLGNLLDSGEQLRVIARDPSKLPAGSVNAAVTWCGVMLDTLADDEAPWRAVAEPADE